MKWPVSNLDKESVFVLDGTHGSPDRTESGIPVLSATNVRDGSLVWDTPRYTTQQEYTAFSKRLRLSKGDVLLTIVGTIGRAAVLTTDPPPVVFQRSVSVIRPDKNRLDSKYLYWVTQSRDFQSQLSRFTNKSSQAGVYLKKLKTAEIPLPPLPEQKRIASILDAGDALRAKRRESIEQLDSLLQATFLEMFGDPVTNPKGWEVHPLGSMCDVRDGTHDSPKYVDAGYPLLTSKNFADGHVDYSGAKLISEEDYRQINKRSGVDVGDLVMPMIGTIGNPVLITQQPDFAIKNVALIKFDGRSPNRRYVHSLLGSAYFDHVTSKANRGGTQKFVALKDLRAIPTPTPPLDLQTRFASIVESIDQQKARLKAHLAELDTLFASLQSRAFNGELVA
jgi:type I restriction enzyme S subunit